MNKQQLANKIWESANRMRSKIEANEYKDYILGFIFYKFLSDKEVAFLKKDGYEDADIEENAHENNEELVKYCQEHLGYVDEYQGQEIDIEPHIKSGIKDSDPRSVRIYFAYDPTVSSKILIGHCGKHLDNYTTRKIK